jgi:hypothetical protein
MKISFFQTYGDRLPLLKIREEDTLFQKFISNFDLNIISLHNVSDSIKSYVNSTPIVPNQIVWDSQGKTYGQSINFLVDFLLNNKVDRFFFYQDDTFSHEITESNLNDLVITGLIPIFDLINPPSRCMILLLLISQKVVYGLSMIHVSFVPNGN